MLFSFWTSAVQQPFSHHFQGFQFPQDGSRLKTVAERTEAAVGSQEDLLWTPEAFPGPNLRFPRKARKARKTRRPEDINKNQTVTIIYIIIIIN